MSPKSLATVFACFALLVCSCSRKADHLMNNPADEQGVSYVGHDVRPPNDPTNAPVVVLEESSAAIALDTPHTFSAIAQDPNPAGLEPGTVVAYAWDFGDGTGLGEGSAAEAHAYDQAGTYTVTVVVTDDDGNTGSTGARVRVGAAATETECPCTWAGGPPMPTPRDYAAAAAIDGWLYVVGGAARPNAILGALEVYVPQWMMWITGPPMPTPRWFLAAAAIDGLLYVVGGRSENGVVGTLEVFDPGPGTWTAGPPMPTPRYGFAAVEASGRLYVVGGAGAVEDGNPVPTEESPLEIFDPATSVWTTGSPLPAARRQVVAARIGTEIFVVGGESEEIHIYDLATDAWRTGAPMPHTHLRVPAAAAIGGMLYVLGDYGGTGPNDVAIYDPVSDTWAEGPPLERGRWDPAGAAVDGRFFVAGGSRLPCDDSIWCILDGINPVGDFDILGW